MTMLNIKVHKNSEYCTIIILEIIHYMGCVWYIQHFELALPNAFRWLYLCWQIVYILEISDNSWDQTQSSLYINHVH